MWTSVYHNYGLIISTWLTFIANSSTPAKNLKWNILQNVMKMTEIFWWQEAARLTNVQKDSSLGMEIKTFWIVHSWLDFESLIMLTYMFTPAAPEIFPSTLIIHVFILTICANLVSEKWWLLTRWKESDISWRRIRIQFKTLAINNVYSPVTSSGEKF